MKGGGSDGGGREWWREGVVECEGRGWRVMEGGVVERGSDGGEVMGSDRGEKVD